eukprot:gene23308-30548_t
MVDVSRTQFGWSGCCGVYSVQLPLCSSYLLSSGTGNLAWDHFAFASGGAFGGPVCGGGPVGGGQVSVVLAPESMFSMVVLANTGSGGQYWFWWPTPREILYSPVFQISVVLAPESMSSMVVLANTGSGGQYWFWWPTPREILYSPVFQISVVLAPESMSSMVVLATTLVLAGTILVLVANRREILYSHVFNVSVSVILLQRHVFDGCGGNHSCDPSTACAGPCPKSFILGASDFTRKLAGTRMASLLQEGGHQGKSVTLIGFSMGARLIFHCLKELARVGLSMGARLIVQCLKELAPVSLRGIIEHVVLMGAPVSSEPD